MAPSSTCSPRFEFNFAPLLTKSGSGRRALETSLSSWIGSSIAPPDYSQDSGSAPTQPVSQTASILTPNEEPWTPPADAHPAQSLHTFVKAAWRILEPAVPFVDGWHIELLCEHLEALSTNRLPERDLLINEPPGSSKSLITAVFWPAWEWTWAPWTRWLTGSYDDRLALRDAVKTRRLMQSPWYADQIAEPWSFASDQNVKGYYLNDRTGWRIATSISGAATGEHAHRVLIDDPHNVRQAESDQIREGVLTTWREVFPSRVLPGGARVLIGQRVHEEDCTADWLEREGRRIHHIELQEERELESKQQVCSLTGRLHDPRTVEGELLSPERFSAAVVERRKIELGPYAYSAQYQQRPTPRAGQVLDPAWFPQTPRLEPATVDLIAAFDLNYSDSERSDWTIGMLGAIERQPVWPRIHVVDAFRDHLSSERHAQKIADWLLLYRPVLVGIEKRAYEREGATRDLCRQIMAICEESHYAVTIEPIEVDGDKVTRAQILPGRAKQGLITVDRNSKWWPILSRQMSQFPRSAHDDDVDALAHLVRLAIEKLERVRAQQTLLGHSSPVTYGEVNSGVNPADWERMAAMGYR